MERSNTYVILSQKRRKNKDHRVFSYTKEFRIYVFGKVAGCEAEYKKLQKANGEYNEATRKAIEENKGQFDEICKGYQEAYNRRRIVAIIFGVSFIIAIVCRIFLRYTIFSTLTTFIAFVAFVALVITYIMFNKTDKKLDEFLRQYRREIDDIRVIFRTTCKEIYEKIDELYLLSLDPVQRELVLMRRENQRREEEMRMREEEHRRQMESMQRQLVSAQQSIARNADYTKGLLDIEREREARLKR